MAARFLQAHILILHPASSKAEGLGVLDRDPGCQLHSAGSTVARLPDQICFVPGREAGLCLAVSRLHLSVLALRRLAPRSGGIVRRT